MLVLSRKEGEAIQVGSDVTIRVLSVGRGRIRIGIEAPAELPIRRAELPAEKRPAAAAVPVTSPLATAADSWV